MRVRGTDGYLIGKHVAQSEQLEEEGDTVGRPSGRLVVIIDD